MSNVLEKAEKLQFFKGLEDSEIKRLGKKLKESAKDVRNGRLRKFFTSAEYISMENITSFLTLQTEYFYEQWAIEKETKLAFFNDDNEREKAGWNSRKPQEDKLLAWAEDAYPRAKSDIWDVQFEQVLFDNR